MIVGGFFFNQPLPVKRMSRRVLASTRIIVETEALGLSTNIKLIGNRIPL
jgi:hypothetical protein|tara:strand:- start:57 stop:206 length:150 start_codon:yes stop_codon:yes gene_type:complete